MLPAQAESRVVRVLVEHSLGAMHANEGVARRSDKEKTAATRYVYPGITPLYVACENGHEEVVRMLLDAGFDKDKASDAWNNSCVNGHDKVVRLLLSVGADREKANDQGMPPLLMACQKGRRHNAVVSLLLDEGPKSPNMMERR